LALTFRVDNDAFCAVLFENEEKVSKEKEKCNNEGENVVLDQSDFSRNDNKVAQSN
jgi:hypothetical protein